MQTETLSVQPPAQGGNGGHKKAFELIPPRSQEDIVQEAMRQIAPEIRRKVRELPIPAQAKFLFDALLDDSYLHRFGGDGRGKLFASLSDLAQRYGHRRETIRDWLELLKAERVVWERRAWPFSEFRITAIAPPPKLAQPVSDPQMLRARASAEQCRENAHCSPENALLPFSQENQGTMSEEPAYNVGTSSRGCGNYRQGLPAVPAGVAGTCPQRLPEVPTKVAGTLPQRVREVPTKVAGTLPQRVPVLPAGVAGTSGNTEETPGAFGAFGGLEPSSVQRANASKGGGGKRSAAENAFIRDVSAVMDGWRKGHGRTEVDQSHGWWTQCYRTSPRKARRVLADTSLAIKQRSIATNPGAYAVDAWRRFA